MSGLLGGFVNHQINKEQKEFLHKILDVQDNITIKSLVKMQTLIKERENQIRQDQKEKCVKSIQELKFGSIHPQHAINVIMEAD